MSRIWHRSSRYNFNEFSYDAVWAKHRGREWSIRYHQLPRPGNEPITFSCRADALRVMSRTRVNVFYHVSTSHLWILLRLFLFFLLTLKPARNIKFKYYMYMIILLYIKLQNYWSLNQRYVLDFKLIKQAMHCIDRWIDR